ncbi:hypothetical protein [Micromonospora sp. NPDC049662]|uniref:hypothetical protein n=1 Tax=Micromonospora sp. NPDC049662 TaxID=3155397 RepID=UPI0034190819
MAAGRWEAMRDAEPVRQHVQSLLGTDLTLRRVAELSGVSFGALERLLYGKGGTPPTRRMLPELADALLEITATVPSRAHRQSHLVDAVGARRRLQALAVIGWSFSDVARRLGCTAQTVHRYTRQPYITQAKHDQLAVLYDELRRRPAHDPERRVRNHARRQRWNGPQAWTPQTIDDPAAEPALPDLVDAAGTRRRVEALCHLGWSLARQAVCADQPVAEYAALLRQSMVTAEQARAVTGVYDALGMTAPLPGDTDAVLTRRWATEQGFLPALLWDDDTIDDPAANARYAILAHGEHGDEALIWRALHWQVPIETLPNNELAILNRHRHEYGLIPRGPEAITKAYLAHCADGCSRAIAAIRLGIPKTRLDQALWATQTTRRSLRSAQARLAAA